jgi:Eukaryotic aspartyl protease
LEAWFQLFIQALSPESQSLTSNTGKSASIPFRSVEKWFSATPLALLTPCVSIIPFSHYLTDIFPQGTSVVVAGLGEVADLYSLIPGSQPEPDGFYSFPCDDDLPDISFYFSGQRFSITRSFNIGPIDLGSDRCTGGIRGREDAEWWTLGNTFITNYYTIFDIGQPGVRGAQVGFATLA